MRPNILIVGSCGSGKTTLAKYLCNHLNLRHVELDALSHLENWQSRSGVDLRTLVDEQTKTSGWVVCGNYESLLGDCLWQRATTVIWLDDSFGRTLLRLTLRSLRRLLRNEELWNGNRETWRRTFSRDSIFWWFFTTYRKRRKRLLPRMTGVDYPQAKCFHIKNSRDYRSLLGELRVPPQDWGFHKIGACQPSYPPLSQ